MGRVEMIDKALLGPPGNAVQLLVKLAFRRRGETEEAQVILRQVHVGVDLTGLPLSRQGFKGADGDLKFESQAHGGFYHRVNRALVHQDTNDVIYHARCFIL